MRPLLTFMITVLLVTSCDGDKKKAAEKAEKTPPKDEPTGEFQGPVEMPFADHMGGVRLTNLGQLGQMLGTGSYHDAGYRGQNTTIAVLDNGYVGLDAARGKTLPPDIAIETPAVDNMATTPHGTKIAEIAYAVATGRSVYSPEISGPEMKLYVTNGPYKNLEHAVDELVAYKAANPRRSVIVLYSQIWEYGGNTDGEGYINSLVNRAVNAGVLWVNAAGNLGRSSYFAEIEYDGQGNVQLPDEGRFLKIHVEEPQTEVKIVLGWQDFTDTYYHYRTSQDLDVVLESSDGKELGAGRLIQDGMDHGEQEGYSRHAREMVRGVLNAGTYLIRVEARSRNFPVGTRFWVTASGAGVTMENSNGNNVVFMPADNPNVLTVGASDVDYGNAKTLPDGRKIKPEILAPSIMMYADGVVIDGTSTAAAVAAGAMAVLQSAYGTLSKQTLDSWISQGYLGEHISTSYGAMREAPALRLPRVEDLKLIR